jgi:hypothetical protein
MSQRETTTHTTHGATAAGPVRPALTLHLSLHSLSRVTCFSLIG